jgi:hypothetical protein
VPGAAGEPACATLRLVAAGEHLFASNGGAVYTSVGASTWTRLPVLPESEDAVRVLAARADATSSAVVAATGATLHRYDGQAWTTLPELPDGTPPPESASLLGTGTLVGTPAGVFFLGDGDQQWETLGEPANVPVTADVWTSVDGSVRWRLPDGDVLHRDASGAWTTEDTNLPPGLTGIVERPSGGLMGMRDGQLVTVSGTTTTPFTPSPTVQPIGVVHAGGATFVWAADCKVASLADR